MYAWNLENERAAAETYLLHRQTDFTTTYMEVSNLQYIIAQNPEIVQLDTAAALCCVLCGKSHSRQRQVFFLFKKAADALAAMLCHPTPDSAAEKARTALARVLSDQTGHAFRAAAEAMGALPLATGSPVPPDFPKPSPRMQSVLDLSEITGTPLSGQMQWMGRSLLIDIKEAPGRLLVLKFARPGQPVSELASEAYWMQYLSQLREIRKSRSAVPEPVTDQYPVVYRLSAFALGIPGDLKIDAERHAIAFKVYRSYFCYPNHPGKDGMLPKAECRRILGRSAHIFGRLASRDIIHTAPIPLFHNRVQRYRREDRGLYQWHRGGRLDQWLASCRYPNFCKSGIRDFEHLIAFDGPARRRYEHIGAHAFSLILVAGSYCRNHDETRTGLDSQGRPVDARDLFDRNWLKDVLNDVFCNYYEGFTGQPFSGSPPCDLDLLSRRLVAEMGVDRHMEEILRVAEQEAMSPAEFRDFLSQRGFDPQTIRGMKKGEQDIRIMTGPHLGGFNERISVPELTQYAAALSARCIMDRYCRQRFAAAGIGLHEPAGKKPGFSLNAEIC
ncbi:MAG: SidJ-related pseudokinase [Desulfobacterales bacterium]|nr:SidJ-related pseudokinase [Desulfobacterales bacterium]MBS3755036.1 SidJ-related pseudokinase [Desulfobacterales bacterium]